MNFRTRISNRSGFVAIALSSLALLALLALLTVAGSASAQGYTEVNQAIVDAQGGFPYTISQPGSYRLTSNLIKTAGNDAAIVIAASNVDLNLADFFIQAPGTCARNGSTGAVTCSGHLPGSGIQESGFSNVTIRNGKVIGFFNGISMTGTNHRIDRVTVTDSAFVGVSAIGDGTTIYQVGALRNGTTGIVIQNNSVVSNCNASQNDDYGIIANLASTVTRSFAMGNHLGGMSLNTQAVFSLNSVLDNFGADPVFSGIDAGDNTCTNAVGTPVGC